TRTQNAGSVAGMSNVLDDDKQQQIRALGRLGWTLSRIQDATGIRRETISGYLKTAGIAVRRRGRPSESTPKPALSVEVFTAAGGSLGQSRGGKLDAPQSGVPGFDCPPPEPVSRILCTEAGSDRRAD